MGIDHRRFQAGMAEQILNHTDVVTGLQEMGGEGVADCFFSCSFSRNLLIRVSVAPDIWYFSQKSRKNLSHLR